MSAPSARGMGWNPSTSIPSSENGQKPISAEGRHFVGISSIENTENWNFQGRFRGRREPVPRQGDRYLCERQPGGHRPSAGRGDSHFEGGGAGRVGSLQRDWFGDGVHPVSPAGGPQRSQICVVIVSGVRGVAVTVTKEWRWSVWRVERR